MMKRFCLTLLAGMLYLSCPLLAQDNKDESFGQNVKQAGKETGKAAKKAGKKTAELGAKSAAKVKDKSLKQKGPKGETVYIDKYERKYYVNRDARRVYIN